MGNKQIGFYINSKESKHENFHDLSTSSDVNKEEKTTKILVKHDQLYKSVKAYTSVRCSTFFSEVDKAERSLKPSSFEAVGAGKVK